MPPQFADSLWALRGPRKIGVARAVVRACAETILGQQMNATHNLRRALERMGPNACVAATVPAHSVAMWTTNFTSTIGKP